MGEIFSLTMNKGILYKLLNLSKRRVLYEEILGKFKQSNASNIVYSEYNISEEGKFPVIIIGDNNEIKAVKIFIAAQHNEYNGLFGIINYLQNLDKAYIENIAKDQIIIFFPLMNPYGFLNPNKENRSGYTLVNGSNLNRFWRKAFIPEYNEPEGILDNYGMPVQTQIVKKIIMNYWKDEDIAIYLMDFHETSLLERCLKHLSLRLNEESYTYKISHWLQEKILINIIELNHLFSSHMNIFVKCKQSAGHKHLNLSMKEVNLIYEKLLEYITRNDEKLPFFFCYSNKSKIYCENLAKVVYFKLKDILWETKSPAYPHYHNHGCFINLNDNVNRNKLYCLELESKKQFFDIFEEINNSKLNPDYYPQKLNSINKSIELVGETIKEMIKLF